MHFTSNEYTAAKGFEGMDSVEYSQTLDSNASSVGGVRSMLVYKVASLNEKN
jgi:hypothetical protein